MWWILILLLILSSPLLGEILMGLFKLFLEGHVALGRWSFRQRANGSVSKWQIAGQIATALPLIVLCAIGVLWFLQDVFRKTSR